MSGKDGESDLNVLCKHAAAAVVRLEPPRAAIRPGVSAVTAIRPRQKVAKDVGLGGGEIAECELLVSEMIELPRGKCGKSQMGRRKEAERGREEAAGGSLEG